MSTVALVKLGFIATAVCSAALTIPRYQPETYFSPEETQSIQKFWSESKRHVVTFLPEADLNGPYAARQTPEGSKWLYDYFKARGNAGKIIPGTTPDALNDRQKEWDVWIESQYTWDEWQAKLYSWEMNQRETGRSLTPPTPPNNQLPSQPAPIPTDLLKLAGEPPKFVTAVTPRYYKTDFGDFIHAAADNTPIRRKYAYYRFAEGIMDGGEPMKGNIDKIKPLFAKAGISDSQMRVMGAVSLLEGGFDSINTYDTGYVSVGFIQFASLSGGAGSLGQVMLNMKNSHPDAFNKDFRRFGLDVTPEGALVALNLETGEAKIGPDANTEIINNRRYASLFVRAGRLSEPFKLAQIRVAVDAYYPADDTIIVNIGGAPQTARIKDFIRTEAGMATLMDRKVNTGKYGDFVQICETYAADYGIQQVRDLAKLEYQITRAMKYRKDYMTPEYALSKPRDLGLIPSRGGNRTGGTPPPKKSGGL